jgi:hypothetical protein
MAYTEEELKRNLPGIFQPYQSLTSMQPEVAQDTVVEQQPMPQRVNVGAYLDDMSAIQANRNKWSARARMFGGSVQFPSVGGDVKERAGIRDEMIQAEILKRQRDAILRGDINNIDEQMRWYQSGGYDPHFAKEARTAAQSIFDQRFQETGAETARKVEERAVRGAELREDEAVRAAARFKFAEGEDRRKIEKHSSEKTDKSRNELKTARENLLLRWAAKKWWDLKPEERTEAKREEIGREMTVIAENPDFQRFDGDEPFYGRDQYTAAPSPVDLDEKSLIDTFRNEAKVVLKDEDKEDEDFVSVPARTYSDQYEQQWRTAADDFETASDLAGEINQAIRADDTIAPENKQAVLTAVLKNLESVEKGVGRPTAPTDPAALKNQRMFESMVQIAPFPAGGELSTPENIMEAQSGFLRAVQMRERSERASSEYLAELQDPLMKSRIYAELTGMKEMHPNSRGIASEFDPVLVSMRSAISEIDSRLTTGKYKDATGKTVNVSDVDRMNLRKVREQQLRKYADHWGVTLDYADWRHNPKAYRKRKVNF